MNYVKRPRLKRDSRKRSRLRIEVLEDRRLLAATAAADTNRFDVNQDGHVTAVDALQVINYLSLNANGSGEEQTTQKQSAPPSAFDVNQDGNVSPVDALQIINLLNEAPGPETASALQSEPSASVTLPSQIRTRDIVELSIDSFSDLDLTSIERVEIDWGDDRVTSVAAGDLALPLTRLHSYFVPPGTRDVEVNAVAHDGSTVSLASLPIEIVANSPSIVDRVNEGLTAEIFDNTNFSSAPVQIRNDATINFDFGIEGPSPTLGPTALPFSIRWQGTFTPQETASHNLFANVGANDSAAVYVDNQLLFTAAGNEQSASISLTAGQSVELRVEYVAGSGQSHIRVGSETDSNFKTAFPSHQLRPIISAEQLRSGALIETFEAPTLITSIEELRSSESFIANTPASANDLAGLTSSQPAGTHATRTRSIVSVPVSGRYTFHLAASDTAEVYLSQGVTSDTSRVIVSVANEAPPEDFDSPNADASTPIYLVAGQDYYLETLHVHDKASTASHLAVGWTRPDQVELGPQLIDSTFLRPIVPEVTLHADVSQTHEANVVSRNARFVIARSDDLGRDLDVAYTLGGSAINGVDYSQLSGIVTIPAGQDHVIVELSPVDDATLEGPEIAVVRLASDARYQLGVESQRQIQITIAGELQNETQLLPQDIPTLINTGFSSAAGNQITTFHVNDTSLPFVDGSLTDNAIRAVVTTATPDSPWDTLIGYGFDGSPYPAGTPFFASVWARSGNIDGSDATVGLRLQKSGGDYAGEEKVWQVGPEWTLLLLPMTPDFGNGTSDRTVDVRLGYQEQTVELGGFSLVKLDQQSDLDEAPKTIYTYGGRQWDADWREQAASDAATHRTNPIQIKIVDAAGNPIEGAVVTITPTMPSLPIGTAVSPELIVASNPDSLTPEAQRYQAILETFDTITDGGTAQWGPWSLDPQVPRDFLDWVIERDLPYHGHALVWGDLADDPSDNFPTPVSLLDGYNHQLSTNGAAAAKTWLENEILTHVSTTGPANDFSGTREDSTEPRVTWWDVINHPIFAPEIWDIVGYDFIVDILQATRNTVDSNTDLIINEFDILSNPDDGQSDAFFDLLTQLDTTANASTGANAQYDAIGFQGHFVSNRLPDIDRIMQELDRYEVFDRDMQITEFDVDAVDIDPQTQADFTRDFYQTLAATENLTATTLWGIWSGDHWRETPTNPESAALFNQDWTPRANGQWLLDEHSNDRSPNTQTTNTSGTANLGHRSDSVGIHIRLPNGSVLQTEVETQRVEIQIGQLETALDFTTFAGQSSISHSERTAVYGDDFIPVDTNLQYTLTGEARSGDDEGNNFDPNNRQYFGFANYDVDRKHILPWHVIKHEPASDTYLSQQLKSGDTVIHLDDATGWQNAGLPHQRTLAWYGYTNNQGETYDDYTYTRNVDFRPDTGAWAAGAVDQHANTITLIEPWSGQTIAAGTAIRNATSGSTFNYAALEGTVPDTWTTFDAVLTGEGTASPTQFRPGTAFIKPIILTNRQTAGGPTNLIQWQNIRFDHMASSYPAGTMVELLVDAESAQHNTDSAALQQRSWWYQTSGPAATFLNQQDHFVELKLPGRRFDNQLGIAHQLTRSGMTFISTTELSVAPEHPATFETAIDFTTFAGQSSISHPERTAVYGDDFIPVDTNLQYTLTGEARSGDDEGNNFDPNNRQYFGFANYDVDRKHILPWHVIKHEPASDTYLSQQLNPGDTVMHLGDATGWQNAGLPHQRTLAWYGYTNSQGETYDDYTYTRNVDFRPDTGAWAAGAVNQEANTITLIEPWNGPTIAAGTAVRNATSGSTFNYAALAGTVPDTWTTFDAVLTGEGTASPTQFRPGTAFIKPIILTNRQPAGGPTNQIQWRDVSLSLIPSPTTPWPHNHPMHVRAIIDESQFDLDTLVTHWTQKSGPAAALAPEGLLQLQIEFPQSTAPTNLVIELHLFDSLGSNTISLEL